MCARQGQSRRRQATRSGGTRAICEPPPPLPVPPSPSPSPPPHPLPPPHTHPLVSLARPLGAIAPTARRRPGGGGQAQAPGASNRDPRETAVSGSETAGAVQPGAQAAGGGRGPSALERGRWRCGARDAAPRSRSRLVAWRACWRRERRGRIGGEVPLVSREGSRTGERAAGGRGSPRSARSSGRSFDG